MSWDTAFIISRSLQGHSWNKEKHHEISNLTLHIFQSAFGFFILVELSCSQICTWPSSQSPDHPHWSVPLSSWVFSETLDFCFSLRIYPHLLQNLLWQQTQPDSKIFNFLGNFILLWEWKHILIPKHSILFLNT